MEVSKLFTFEAAHMLPRHEGKCRHFHGHSWKLRITITGLVNEYTQFVLDYSKLSDIMRPLIEKFDHQCLNYFMAYPSSENVATYVADYLATVGSLKVAKPISRLQVSVSETEKVWATWDSNNSEDVMRLVEKTGLWKQFYFEEGPDYPQDSEHWKKKADDYLTDHFDHMIGYFAAREKEDSDTGSGHD